VLPHMSSSHYVVAPGRQGLLSSVLALLLTTAALLLCCRCWCFREARACLVCWAAPAPGASAASWASPRTRPPCRQSVRQQRQQQKQRQPPRQQQQQQRHVQSLRRSHRSGSSHVASCGVLPRQRSRLRVLTRMRARACPSGTPSRTHPARSAAMQQETSQPATFTGG
jgi:hypothetical protein